MELLIALGIVAVVVIVLWILVGYPLWNVWASQRVAR